MARHQGLRGRAVAFARASDKPGIRIDFHSGVQARRSSG
jgi:hypothetical protein